MGRVLAYFRLDGRARTKGSLSVYCTKGPAHKVRVEEETKDSARWRRMVALAAQAQQKRSWGGLLGYAGAVEVRMVVWFRREPSTAKGARPGQVIPSHDTPLPTDIKLGDGDKLARNIGDALTDSKLILDDSQVTDFLIAKRWTLDDGDPYVEIFVMEAEDVSRPGWMPLEAPEVPMANRVPVRSAA